MESLSEGYVFAKGIHVKYPYMYLMEVTPFGPQSETVIMRITSKRKKLIILSLL